MERDIASGLDLRDWEDTGIDYSNPATPFVDRFSIFCVHYSAAAFGIGRVGLRANPFIYRFLEPAARLEVSEQDGAWYPVRRTTLRCLPWCVEEKARVAGISIRSRHLFASGRRFLCRVMFCNEGEAPSEVAWRLKGFLPHNEPVPEKFLAPFPGLEPEELESWLQPDISGITGGWRSKRERSSYPRPSFGLFGNPGDWEVARWQESATGRQVPCGWTEGALFYCMSPKEVLQLDPGESKSFLLAFEVAWETSPLREPDWAKIDFEAADEEARKEFGRCVASSTPPPKVRPILLPHAWRARHALVRTGFRDDAGEFAGRRACLCTSDDQFFSTVFFWDSLFSSAALAGFHPAFARDSILTAFVRQDSRDGSTPENKWNFTVPERNLRQFPQAPVGSWATAHYLDLNPGDTEFLGVVYPLLMQNHQFWDRYGDADGDGLAEWRWTGQTADDSPLFDGLVPGGDVRGCQWIPPVASVQLNSFLFKDADLMSGFAKRLGHEADVEYFQSRKHKIQDRLTEVCFVPEEGRFWDYNHATRAHTRVPTFYMFWPLFAGIELPTEVSRELFDAELLDPERFFGAIPFPSVAYNHGKFDPKGYWRGKAWPHISYWLLETLVRHGRSEKAQEAGRRILAWMSARDGFPENFETDPQVIETSGHLDYNWGAAAFLLIASERFLEFTP